MFVCLLLFAFVVVVCWCVACLPCSSVVLCLLCVFDVALHVLRVIALIHKCVVCCMCVSRGRVSFDLVLFLCGLCLLPLRCLCFVLRFLFKCKLLSWF